MAIKKAVTMADIAKHLGISTVSVSKALQNKEGISDTLREKILTASEELGYHYSSPKAPAPVSNGDIGILISERFLRNIEAFYWDVCNQVNKALGENNFFGIVETISCSTEKSLTPPQVINTNKVNGIIILGQMTPSYISFLSKFNLPIIYTDFYLSNLEYDTITTDNFYSSYLLTNYLIQNGHKQIGFLGDIYATSSILDRYLGYLKALLEHRLAVIPEWLLNDRTEKGIISIPALPSNLPTAFVCNCDQSAYSLCEKLKENNYRVPDDISLASFDNNIYAEICIPKLTTVAVDVNTLAAATVSSLMKKIADHTIKVRRKEIPGKLIIRDSVKNISPIDS